jgi:hypothetical protein
MVLKSFPLETVVYKSFSHYYNSMMARTGRIGLRRFLASARVHGVDSDECLCGKGKETAEHVLYAATTHLREHGAEERSLRSSYLNQPLEVR